MKIDFTVIKRYLDDKGTEMDKSRIADWFNFFEFEHELREKSLQYWEEMKVADDVKDYDESLILGRIYREIKLKETQASPKYGTSAKLVGFLAKIAAVLFIPLLLWHVSTTKHSKLSKKEITYIEIYSPIGSRTMFYLPDGSKGWLNGGSYLKYPDQFTGRSRDVRLKGEAFFDVKTNPKKPFIVSSKHLVINAKGTAFNISAWEDELEVEVVLVEGKLDIFHRSKNEQKWLTSLNPGHLFHSVPTTEGSYIQNTDAAKHISWTEGKLIFRDEPFIDVVARINRWYNVNLVIKDDILESYRYVATFQDESLDEVLKMLAISAPIHYKELPRKQLIDRTFEKRTVLLYYNPSSKRKINPMSN
jgi:transmembrane sensor